MTRSNWPTEELRQLALTAVGVYGEDLGKAVPLDAAEYGWDGKTFSYVDFYSELLGALCKYESSFKTEATYTEKFKDRNGDNVISRGLMMISIESGQLYDKALRHAEELHDPAINLRVAVKIMAMYIPRDEVIAYAFHYPQGPYRGMSRYWHPFRKKERIAAIKKAMKQVFEQPNGEEKMKDKSKLYAAIKALKAELNALGANPKLSVEGPLATKVGPSTLAALAKALEEQDQMVGSFVHPIDLMRTMIGLKEKPGNVHERQIQEFLEACDNIGGRKDNKLHADEVPWCSGVINWLAEKCGMEKTNNALAASWDKYNESCGDWVEEGDIVTLAQPGRHVTLANKRFNRKTAKTFEGLGGNQGNSIKVSTYSVSKIKAARKWKPKAGVKVPPVKSSSSGSTADGSKESTR